MLRFYSLVFSCIHHTIHDIIQSDLRTENNNSIRRPSWSAVTLYSFYSFCPKTTLVTDRVFVSTVFLPTRLPSLCDLGMRAVWEQFERHQQSLMYIRPSFPRWQWKESSQIMCLTSFACLVCGSAENTLCILRLQKHSGSYFGLRFRTLLVHRKCQELD